jgi:hypothetical protein
MTEVTTLDREENLPEWTAPELQRLDVDSAEGNAAASFDGSGFS